MAAVDSRGAGRLARRRGSCVRGFGAIGSASILSPEIQTSPLSPEARSRQFHEAVQRTLTSRNFTVRSEGQTLDYQAPDRTRVVEISTGLFGMGISNVTIGANSYVDFGGGNWMKVPTGFGGFFPLTP